MSIKVVNMHYTADFCPAHERDFLPGRLPANWHVVAGAPFRAFFREDGLRVVFSVDRESDRKRWIHVSLSREDRLPDWDDVVDAKVWFCGKERYAVQVIPPKNEYINDHEFCLHLWSCVDGYTWTPDFRKLDAEGRLSV